jgi:signal peptidase II
MAPMLKRILFIAAIFCLIDQAQKLWTVAYFENGVVANQIYVNSFFNLVMVWNRGVSFGMFQSPEYGKYIFSVITILVSLYLLKIAKNEPENQRLHFCVSMIIGGAISNNLFDRFRWGAVADFFDIHVAGWHYPAFNLADCFIVIGTLLLLVFSNSKANNQPKNLVKS